MLRLVHTNQQENTKYLNKYRKSFTLVELIVSISIGAILILGTYNVLGQSLNTISLTSVAGTMDNYANSIQKKIRSELITAKYIDLGAMNHSSNVIDANLGNGTIKRSYKNIYYANKNQLNFGIVTNELEKRVSIAYYPQLDRLQPAADQEFKETKVVFSEEGSNGVKLVDIKWNIDNYHVSADDYISPDYNENPSRLVSYQITLRKDYTNGREPLVKVYNFKEVLECAF